MKSRYQVSFTPRAEKDLADMYDFIARRSTPGRAIRYIGRIQKLCTSLKSFPQRGSRRDDIAPGLRVIGFERRVSIAFRVAPGQVTIARILYGGRHLEGELRDSES